MTWRQRRVGEMADLLNGFPFDSAAFSDEGEVPLVRIRDILGGSFETFVPAEIVPESATIRDGDVVVGMDGDFNVVHWSRGAAALNQRLCLLRANGCADTRFLAYALPAHLQVINDLTYATTVKHLSSGQVRGIRMTVPDLAEQRAIADYLDRETARIDTLIEEQQRLIEMLRERRDGVVTKAFLASAAEETKLKHAVDDVTVGIVVQPSRWYVDAGVPALRGVNVKRGSIMLNDLVQISKEGHEAHPKSQLRSRDVVVVRTGQAGAAAKVPAELDGVNAIDILIIRPGDGTDPDFLVWYLNSPLAASRIAYGSVGAIQGHFNVGALRELPFPVVGLREQQRISTHLDKQVSKIDRMIEETERFIELSKERRSALITAAVTGQIDVRDEVA